MNDNEQKRLALVSEIVAKIAKKDGGKRLTKTDKLDLKMSLFYARDDKFNKGKTDVLVPGNLDLERLNTFDTFNLCHDVFGVDAHIQKDSHRADFGTMMRCFVPRCGWAKKGNAKKTVAKKEAV